MQGRDEGKHVPLALLHIGGILSNVQLHQWQLLEHPPPQPVRVTSMQAYTTAFAILRCYMSLFPCRPGLSLISACFHCSGTKSPGSWCLASAQSSTEHLHRPASAARPSAFPIPLAACHVATYARRLFASAASTLAFVLGMCAEGSFIAPVVQRAIAWLGTRFFALPVAPRALNVTLSCLSCTRHMASPVPTAASLCTMHVALLTTSTVGAEAQALALLLAFAWLACVVCRLFVF
jgi:hypothetical protein